VSRNTSQPLRASDLWHSLTVHAPAGTQETVAAAEDLFTRVPAAITVVPVQFQSPERLDLGGVQSATRYVVSLRYRTDVKADYVLVEECCTARRFQILSIVPSDRRDAIDMTCVTSG
jgi:hypothetical protein